MARHIHQGSGSTPGQAEELGRHRQFVGVEAVADAAQWFEVDRMAVPLVGAPVGQEAGVEVGKVVEGVRQGVGENEDE